MNEGGVGGGRRVLVTGSAGFIGFHLSQALLRDGARVLGIDPLTDYYDVSLKERRLALLEANGRYSHLRQRLEDDSALRASFEAYRPDVVVHLAAQAGVRYALEQPRTYVEANVIGTFNVLECARQFVPRHLLIASTSSVYGSNSEFPYHETQRTDHPMSFYAATKKAGEDMAHSYSYLHGIPTTLFRFFTVYGSWGRPDMAIFKFVRAAMDGSAIKLHDEGRMLRDFTHVTDLVQAITSLMSVIPKSGQKVIERDSISPVAPYRTVNIGGGRPISVLRFVEAVERATGKAVLKEFVPATPGEVPITDADPALLHALTGFTPRVDIDSGVQEFVNWFREDTR